jgi:hypothetical protein
LRWTAERNKREGDSWKRGGKEDYGPILDVELGTFVLGKQAGRQGYVKSGGKQAIKQNGLAILLSSEEDWRL